MQTQSGKYFRMTTVVWKHHPQNPVTSVAVIVFRIVSGRLCDSVTYGYIGTICQFAITLFGTFFVASVGCQFNQLFEFVSSF